MEDTLGFEENIKKESSASEWEMGLHSDLSLGVGSYRQSFHDNLYIVPNKEEIINRPIIIAGLRQKLSYFCCFTSSVSKIEIFCMQQNSINRFLWFYLMNLMCKSLPMTYVYVFLSGYAPDYHFFLPKMVPASYGFNLIFVVTAILGLLVLAQSSALYFVYVVSGLMFKIPWNRCLYDTTNNINCYNLSEFSKKFQEENEVTHSGLFYSTVNENFSLAQMDYFDNILGYDNTLDVQRGMLIGLIVAIWISAAFLYKQLFKEYIWKILHYAHAALVTMLILIFLHIVISYENRNIQKIERADEDDRQYLMNADFDLLAESMTSPPILHIISSRSTKEINPSQDSAIIITLNAINYLFRALTTYMMKKYCESWIKGSIIYWDYGCSSIFYFWPVYFATLYWGDFFVIIFFALNGIVDCCTFYITFSCLVETIIYEWTWIKPWCAKIVIVIAALSEELLNDTLPSLANNYFIPWTAISTLAETIIIFWLYPLGRFVDDITFHYGMPPTKLRIWSFIVVPIYYMIKVYIIIKRFTAIQYSTIMMNTSSIGRFSFICQAVLVCLGAAYMFYCFVIKQKKSWTHLFKPAPEWGPRDFESRQLRKQFDSREYIGSQAERVLSRHLIRKAELKSYKLDIPYGSVNRRTAVQSER